MEMQADPTPLLTSREATKLLNLPTQTIRDMIHRKELPAYKAGSNGVSVNRSDETDSALSLSWASDVAYAYGLQHMTGTKIDGEKVDL